MRHRGTYIPPDTPKRRRPGPAAVVIGTSIAICTIAGVSAAVASPAPLARPRATEGSGRPAITIDVISATQNTSESDYVTWEIHLRARIHATPPLRGGGASSAVVAAAGTAASAAADVAAASAAASPTGPSPLLTPSETTTPSAASSASQIPASVAAVASDPASASASAPSASSSSSAGSSASASAGAAGTVGRLFAAASPWNTPIAQGAATDPDSSAVVARVLNNPSLVVNLNMYAFGIPFYTATDSTPRVLVNGLRELGPIPIDPSWQPNEGADHKMNVIDPATHTVFELQGFDAGARSAFWGVKKDYRTSLADGYPADGRAGPTGSGLTQAGGVVRLAEMASGKIDHALSFITSRPVNRFRYPASHSDGNVGGIGLEEGMRIQLDPTLDVDAIPGITPGEKAIAKALQRYGAYCTDTGGGNNQAMGIYVEKPKAGDADPYPKAGLPQDWAQLPHIPRDRLRVLAVSATPRPNG